MTVVVRFAPSPTGYLHVGNARIAIANWLFCCQQKGEFIYRLDDTDVERSEEKYASAIEEDFDWLGIKPHRFSKQSTRFDRYREALDHLKNSGRLYPCFETQEELEVKRKIRLSRGLPPVYDRAALELTQEQKQNYLDEGRKPHWRFKINDDDVSWNDLIRGPVHFSGSNLGDPVLERADGVPVYTIATVVDDIDLGVTHILRGEDHVANTAVQLQIAKALGADISKFHFAHLSLLIDASGQGFSKRLGSLSLRQLRMDGYESMALNSLLAFLGTSDAIEPEPDMEKLIANFDLTKFSRATPKFDIEELNRLNHKLIQKFSIDDANARLDDNNKCRSEELWNAAKGNLNFVRDIALWNNVIDAANLENNKIDSDFAKTLFETMPNDFEQASWDLWIADLKSKTGLLGKKLFMPIRIALTGMEHGPELRILASLIGRDKCVERIKSSF